MEPYVFRPWPQPEDAPHRRPPPTPRPPARTPAISLRGVRKEFAGGVVAVQGLDLDVAEGEFVTLLGPSGCGKTTLLRTVAGFVRQAAGQVLIDGARPSTTCRPTGRGSRASCSRTTRCSRI